MAEYPFLLHPRLLELLGEQLVQKEVRALLELVKNSYDADATVVRVEWREEDRQLLIADDGHGMDEDAIRDGWSVLGTPKKEMTTESPGGRIVVGSKGLGRMSVATLGSEALIQTGTGEGDWREFRFNIGEIQAVAARDGEAKITADPRDRPDKALAEKGTVITISAEESLVPDQEAHDEIVSQLQLLVNPRFTERREEDAFVIQFTSPYGEASPVEGIDVSHEPPIRVTAEVRGPRSGVVTIRGNQNLYEAEDDLQDWVEYDIEGPFDEIQGARCEILWRQRGASPKERRYWAAGAGDELGEATGFHIYRDHIRVQPYGDPDQDWLRMEQEYTRTGSRMRHPRPIQIFGWAEVSRNHGLEDNPSREGLRNTKSFKQLKDFCDQAVKFLQSYRQEFEPVASDSDEPQDSEKKDVQEAREAYKRLKEETKDDPEAQEHLERVESVFDRYEEAKDQVALFRERTSAGLVASLVLHDSGISLSQNARLVEIATSKDCEIEFHGKVLETMSSVIPRVVEGYELLRGAARSGGYRAREFDAGDTIGTIVENFKHVLDRPLALRYAQETIHVNMREADLWSILVNYLHNGITSADYDHASTRSFPQEREVVVSAELVDGDLVVSVEDNGPGLPTKPKGWIWERTNTTRGGGGSGLGLWIVRDVVEGLGGYVEASDAEGFNSGARFAAVIPQVGV